VALAERALRHCIREVLWVCIRDYSGIIGFESRFIFALEKLAPIDVVEEWMGFDFRGSIQS
jgi:hypothetical protein